MAGSHDQADQRRSFLQGHRLAASPAFTPLLMACSGGFLPPLKHNLASMSASEHLDAEWFLGCNRSLSRR